MPSNGDNSNFISKDMFPKLTELFENIDEALGFDIEIKYPLDLEVCCLFVLLLLFMFKTVLKKDGTNEADSSVKWMDRNQYADIILKCLLNDCKIDKRCIILTTFDPTLSIM